MSSSGGQGDESKGESGVAVGHSVTSRSQSLSDSEVSSESHLVEQEEMESLTRDVRELKEAIGRLHRSLHASCSSSSCSSSEIKAAECQERLNDLLRILRLMLERHPVLQSNELVESASYLIFLVRELKGEPGAYDEALDGLALAVRSRVTEYLSGDLDSGFLTSHKAAASSGAAAGVGVASASLCEEEEEESSEDVGLSTEEMDSLLMAHEQGVDHALWRSKVWSKYAKDVLSYVEKRSAYELEHARNMTKLAQTMRPLLKEESFLPFQSIYCTALDQDLENCASIQSTARNLQSHKFMEPLSARRLEHERNRKHLKERWYKELKKMHESVNNLRKAKSSYMVRMQEYERCREAVRIAEQGAEIGATGENKVDKRKRLEEEAQGKTLESEIHYKNCVSEANARHRNLLFVKAEFLQQIRELILMCDQTMKAVTVSYFHLQHGLTANLPVQFMTLCESARLYEPGSQFMEYVKRMPKPQAVRFSAPDPFSFEPYSEEAVLLLLDKQRKTDPESAPDGTYKMMKSEPRSLRFWSHPEPSDTESIDSHDSGRSQEEATSSPSPGGQAVNTGPAVAPVSSSEEVDFETDPLVKTVGASRSGGCAPNASSSSAETSSGRRQILSKAAQTHKFRKLKTFSKCRECDSFLFQGYECQECGLSSHKKCLETLAIQCGHKRLLRKMTTFGVDLSQHLSETGSVIPPLVCKCLHEIDQRGIHIKGIYRTSGVKSKVEKLCQSFENGAELVELTDVTPNVIANVLKLYLRQLPEPLLTTKLYSDFIRAAKSCPAKADETGINADLRALVCKLPRSHLLTLANLMHHLRRISSQSDSNNMPASNLAIVFGPTLLRTSEAGGADLSAVADAVHQARAVELLILNAKEIFGTEESVKPRDFLKYTSPPCATGHNKENNDEFFGRRESELFRLKEAIEEGRASDHSHPSNPILAAYLAGEVHSEDEEEYADIPDFLLPESSSSTSMRLMKKSPLLVRNSSPPKIIKQSLKNFSGLEGVTPGMLSTQDSLEVVQRLSKSSSAASSIDHPTPPSQTTSTGQGVLVKQQRLAIFPLEGSDAAASSLDVPSETASKKPSPVSSTSSSSSGGVILRSYQSPGSGRSSLLIGINSTSSSASTSAVPPRSSSLSVDYQELGEHRRKIQSLSCTSTSGILNLEENKVKIVVPGGILGGSLQATTPTSRPNSTTSLTSHNDSSNDKGVD